MATKSSLGIRSLAISIFANLLLSIFLVKNTWGVWTPNASMVAVLIIATWIAADFVSGFVHWAADTWGSEDLFLVGPALIRPFREHHYDPLSITRHNWIETNGANCLISVPILLAISLFQTFSPSTLHPGWVVSYVSFNIWIVLTNQFHKWAHQKDSAFLARLLQRMRIILRPEDHEKHHFGAHDQYYCITSGILNSLLTKIGFFSFLNNLIERVSNLRARRESVQLRL